MILKLLLLVGVITLVYFIFIKKTPIAQKPGNENKNDAKNDALQSNDMVECSACKIYCSLEDALLSNGKYYCSSECLEKSK